MRDLEFEDFCVSLHGSVFSVPLLDYLLEAVVTREKYNDDDSSTVSRIVCCSHAECFVCIFPYNTNNKAAKSMP